MPGTAPNPSMAPQDFASYVQQRGGLAAAKPTGKDRIPDPDPTLAAAGMTVPNPNPAIRYDFKDGSWLVAHFDPTTGAEGEWKIDDAGTTTKPATSGETAAENAQTAKERADEVQRHNLATEAEQQAAQNEAVRRQNAIDAQNATNQAQRNAIDQGNLVDAQTRTALSAAHQQLADQVASGQMSNDEAIQAFKELYDQATLHNSIEQTAQSAGNSAVAALEKQNANRVGPGFGAHFAAGLAGVRAGAPGQVGYTGSDFTYPTPNYVGAQQQAANATRDRLLSYALALQAQQGRANAPVPQYQPPVIQQAAQAAVQSQAPQAATIPPYRPGFPQ